MTADDRAALIVLALIVAVITVIVVGLMVLL